MAKIRSPSKKSQKVKPRISYLQSTWIMQKESASKPKILLPEENLMLSVALIEPMMDMLMLLLGMREKAK
jgi:hypothetical protein